MTTTTPTSTEMRATSVHWDSLTSAANAYLSIDAADSNRYYMLTIVALHILGSVVQKAGVNLPARTARFGEFLSRLDAVTTGGKRSPENCCALIDAQFSADHMVACAFFVAYSLAHGVEAMDRIMSTRVTSLVGLIRFPSTLEFEQRKEMYAMTSARAQPLLAEYTKLTSKQRIYLRAVGLLETVF